MALVQRLITISFTLASGTFAGSGAPSGSSITVAGSGSNTLTVGGARVSCKIVKAGTPGMGSAQIRVNGLTLSQMNQLSTLGRKVTLVQRNTVTVLAGDAVGGMFTVFVGTIMDAYLDAQGAPDVAFQVMAMATVAGAVQSLPYLSYTGPTPVATVMGDLAAKMNLKLENNGVTTVVPTPYYWGSPMAAARACAAAARCGMYVDNGVLAVWPQGGARQAGTTPLISPATGMVGYPAYTAQGLRVKSIFNPSVLFQGAIEVQSSLTPANGIFYVNGIDYDLESMVPGGQWFMSMDCYRNLADAPLT